MPPSIEKIAPYVDHGKALTGCQCPGIVEGSYSNRACPYKIMRGEGTITAIYMNLEEGDSLAVMVTSYDDKLVLIYAVVHIHNAKAWLPMCSLGEVKSSVGDWPDVFLGGRFYRRGIQFFS